MYLKIKIKLPILAFRTGYFSEPELSELFFFPEIL